MPKVLWIDTDVDIIRPSMKLVEDRAFVQGALTLDSGETHLKECEYDLIILELIYTPGSWTNPRATDSDYLGIDFIRYIRDSEFRTPIGLFTLVDINSDRNSGIRESIEADIGFYIQKPCLPSTLFEAALPYLE